MHVDMRQFIHRLEKMTQNCYGGSNYQMGVFLKHSQRLIYHFYQCLILLLSYLSFSQYVGS